MALSPEQHERRQQRIEDCRELYLKYGGEDHELIEKEMRELGHRSFHRRILYRRYERGSCDTGWIERFGWDRLVKMQNAEKSSTPYEGGVAAASADGVVLSAGNGSPHSTNSTNSTNSLDFDDFKEWLQSRTPSYRWDFKHQVHVYKYLRRVFDGDLKRLMIFMPPRHGKSELVTKHFAAYWLKHNPSKNIIVGCYNQKLANRFSRGIRSIHLQDMFLEAESFRPAAVPPDERKGFALPEGSQYVSGGSASGGGIAPDQYMDTHGKPEAFRSSSGKPQGCCLDGSYSTNSTNSMNFSSHRANTAAEWETPEGGGVRAVGVGAGITGYGANLIIIDDPVKSRAEANSATYRDRVYDWFNDDLTTRLEPGGAIVLIQTRWH